MNEVLKTSDMVKLNSLKTSADQTSKTVEEMEELANKLEKEMLNWNGQRKLKKRDLELEESDTLITEYTEDLSQER